MGTRPLSPDEAALWARVMAGVRPLVAQRALVAAAKVEPPQPFVPSSAETPARAKAVATKPAPVPAPASRLRSQRTEMAPPPRMPANTLDGTWDRRLARGLVSPDRTIDLHGHTLHSAYDLLDAVLAASIRDGDRTILLVTGKPPRSASERPHARGAIRAAAGDWLAASRHASAIAAVRPAHARHGGAGALYIVLKKPQPARKS